MSQKWKWSGVPGNDLHDALKWAVFNINPQSYLEIGVDGGGSLRTVLTWAIRGSLRVTLIDPFNVNHAGHGFTSFEHIGPILREFDVRDTRLEKSTSALVLPRLTDSFDLITVDGDHSEEAGRADLEGSWPLLNRGGLLVFDDCGHANYPHLKQVLLEFLANHEDAELIEEDGASFRNCAIIKKLW